MNKNPESFTIEFLIKNGHKLEEAYNNFARQVTSVAIEAIEKQIPKEPKWEGPTNEAKDNAEAYCPECDYYFKDETSYCPDCGQKMLWP